MAHLGCRDVQGLSDALIQLDSEPDERNRRARATFEQAAKFIPTWAERIGEEIEMLEQLGMTRN